MSIVCGTDFSAPAQEAARVAARMAARLGEPLVLVHVIDEIGASATLAGEHAAIYDPRREALATQVERLADTGAAIESLLVAGNADDRMLDIASSRKAQLLVVAALGRHAGQIELGSVAEGLLRAADLPLLVLRTYTPFHAWIDGKAPLHVIVGDDLGPTGGAALAWVPSLRRVGPITTNVLHVTSADDVNARYRASASGDALDPHAEEALRRELKERAQRLAGEEPGVILHIADGRVDAQVVSTAERMAADLIVLGTAQRTGLSRLWKGSVASGVMQSAHSSVAIVPPA